MYMIEIFVLLVLISGIYASSNDTAQEEHHQMVAPDDVV